MTTPTSPPKKNLIGLYCTNPVAMPVDGRGGACPAVPPVATLLLSTYDTFTPKSKQDA